MVDPPVGFTSFSLATKFPPRGEAGIPPGKFGSAIGVANTQNSEAPVAKALLEQGPVVQLSLFKV